MNKKFLLVVLTAIAAVSLVLFAGSCKKGGNGSSDDASGSGSGDAHRHVYGEWVQVEAPSCTEAGLEQAVCEGCEEGTEGHIITQPVSPLGHKYGAWDVDLVPTAEAVGHASKVCSVCDESVDGHEVSVELPVIGDAYQSVELEPADCEADGSQQLAIEIDGEVISFIAPIPALGHDWDLENAEPYFEKYGDSAMGNCDPDNLVPQTVLAHCKHNYDHTQEMEKPAEHVAYWNVDPEPNAESEGHAAYECLVCDTVLNEVDLPVLSEANIEAGVYTYEEYYAPTCLTPGYGVYTHVASGAYFYYEPPALGGDHEFGAWNPVYNEEDGALLSFSSECVKCGASESISFDSGIVSSENIAAPAVLVNTNGYYDHDFGFVISGAKPVYFSFTVEAAGDYSFNFGSVSGLSLVAESEFFFTYEGGVKEVLAHAGENILPEWYVDISGTISEGSIQGFVFSASEDDIGKSFVFALSCPNASEDAVGLFTMDMDAPSGPAEPVESEILLLGENEISFSGEGEMYYVITVENDGDYSFVFSGEVVDACREAFENDDYGAPAFYYSWQIYDGDSYDPFGWDNVALFATDPEQLEGVKVFEGTIHLSAGANNLVFLCYDSITVTLTISAA